MSTTLMEFTIVLVQNAKMLNTLRLMMLNYISTRKDLSEIIGLGQVMGRCMIYIVARALLLVVGIGQV